MKDKSNVANHKPLSFSLGQVYSTPGALEALQRSGQSVIGFLARHVRCDWGEVCKEDAELNDQAVLGGRRILSAYRTSQNERLWVITEASRGSTTLLLPNEY
jgi:hypothetical protein